MKCKSHKCGKDIHPERLKSRKNVVTCSPECSVEYRKQIQNNYTKSRHQDRTKRLERLEAIEEIIGDMSLEDLRHAVEGK